MQAGDKILALDDQITRVTIQGAEARLAAARAEVESLKAAWREKQAELAVAEQTADYALRDYERQRTLPGLKPGLTVGSRTRPTAAAIFCGWRYCRAPAAAGASGGVRLGGNAEAPIYTNRPTPSASAHSNGYA